MYKAIKIIVKGKVQGVGFRPFIYALSKKYHFNGTVQNNLDGVIILAEGEEGQLEKMLDEIKRYPPKLAKINEVTIHQIPLAQYKEFTIIPSQENGRSIPWIPSDAAICENCLEEMKDPSNRRFQYPFINCTQCGPRYTIINRLPYDRSNTTMKVFTMCHDCQVEYENPTNRRHHAQPICCSVCGPTVTLYNQRGESLAENQSAIIQTVNLIKQGKIVAIKGIGGFHLACDAYQEKVVDQLRLKKKRPQKPLAIMAKSLEVVRKLCFISSYEEDILTSSEMPIVILQRKSEGILPSNISPGLSTIGVMLPYTPLHHLLFENKKLECIIMTSANPSGLPILYRDDHLEYLQNICDYILTHNRKINFPIDDSVVQYDGKNTIFVRRARGFFPVPRKTTSNVDQIIALGGNQKNTFSVGKKNSIVMSSHIGDLENEEMIDSFKKQLHHYQAFLGVKEVNVAVDKHPLYASTSIVKELDCNIISIQHHHAHHVSCMEDNGFNEPCLGIILDGTGYGEDGNIWGFEFLYGDAKSFERLAHLKYTPLPGGEKAVKEPWRNAVGMLLYYWPQEGKELCMKLFPERLKEINMMEQMIVHQMNTPMAGTCGRLFDAISAILGICSISTYEGEAAIKLSDYMNKTVLESTDEKYSFHIKTNTPNLLQLDLSPMIYQIIQDKLQQQSITAIIQKFHMTLVSCGIQVVSKLLRNRPELNRTVVLSGGSFQNVFLASEIQKGLEKEGFNVYTHRNVPCNDGGLSLGQIIIAAHQL
ncbi:carbamoyltransferase HypF [Niallia endozanthoxylica]|uniref:Carbamoyltransferase n=1 Tax=Niallia endozanthoxylica TaxID=2036016 RepID=A0A5J5I3W9_9BACI|nr:carbamoyltransferase HypF [Niallia endozanthoxylica]KAA9031174.1 carbamoyltransferase HypF [Niallia endozanthoxylica]